MTTQRSPKARAITAHLEALADRAGILSIPFVAAFMALALIHVG
jgi:hypothetical protein